MELTQRRISLMHYFSYTGAPILLRKQQAICRFLYSPKFQACHSLCRSLPPSTIVLFR